MLWFFVTSLTPPPIENEEEEAANDEGKKEKKDPEPVTNHLVASSRDKFSRANLTPDGMWDATVASGISMNLNFLGVKKK